MEREATRRPSGAAMKEGRPSATALRVASYRAAHQLFDDPKVLDDPVALRILTPVEVERLRLSPWAARGPFSYPMRAWMVARSRFAEGELARARDRGVEQFVILGAGLDTFAYRQPPDPRPLQVFEVDFPATQDWKRQRLRAAGIRAPDNVRYVPTNFDEGSLAADLRATGFDPGRPAFFSWLGVTMYLTAETVDRTLAVLATTPPGGGLVLDYFGRRDAKAPIETAARAIMAHWVARAGEPFRSSWPPGVLGARLRALGFRRIEELDADALNRRYFDRRGDRLRVYTRNGSLLGAER
jgi:methyltransferase (TIGR00027 family)